MSKWTKVVVAALLCITLLCGCGSGGDTSGTDTSKDSTGTTQQTGESQPADTQTGDAASSEEMPTLVYYTFADRSKTQDGEEAVFAKLNEITREKIGCNLDVKFVEVAQFEQQMQNKLASGEQIDLMYTSTWLNLYAPLVSRNALLPLDDLLPVYAKEYYESIPSDWWDCTRINGKIYAAINQQVFARQPYFSYPSNIVEEVGFDWENATTYEDVEDYFKKCADAGYTSDQYSMWGGIDGSTMNEYYEFQSLGGEKTPGVIRYENDGKPVVFDQYESEEFQSYYKFARHLYEEGYVDPNVLTSTLEKPSLFRRAGAYQPYYVESLESGIFTQFAYEDVQALVKPIGKPFITTDSVIATMIGVTVNSKYPEKAVELINLINTDKEFYNTFVYGIEGVDYILNDEGKLEKTESPKYDISVNAWAYGNVFNGYVLSTDNENVWKEQDAMNKSAACSDVMGFNCDLNGVQTEVANCTAVIGEYEGPLMNGLLDFDSTYAEFIQKLKEAGVDTIIAEKQAQLDAFWEANH